MLPASSRNQLVDVELLELMASLANAHRAATVWSAAPPTRLSADAPSRVPRLGHSVGIRAVAQSLR